MRIYEVVNDWCTLEPWLQYAAWRSTFSTLTLCVVLLRMSMLLLVSYPMTLGRADATQILQGSALAGIVPLDCGGTERKGEPQKGRYEGIS